MSDQPMVNLNVTDISDAVKVIDHACEQGAFRGWTNIRQILALRDRLDLFTTAANAIPTETPPSPTSPTPTSPETPETAPVDETTTPPANSRRQRQTRMSARS
jgi:hypothetical protein